MQYDFYPILVLRTLNVGITKVIIAKLKQHSRNLKSKDSGIKIPNPINEAISKSIPVSENHVWSMTVQGRLMNYLTIITKINMNSRPVILDKETGQSYPIMILDGLRLLSLWGA